MKLTQTTEYTINEDNEQQSVSERLLLLDCIFHTDMGHEGYDVERVVRKSFTLNLQSMPIANRNTLITLWLSSRLAAFQSQDHVETGAVLVALRETCDWLTAYDLMPEETETSSR